jgi:hypothetical protein
MHATAWGRWPVLAILVFLPGIGCGRRSDPASASGLKTLPVSEVNAENGWPLYEVPAEGFALALPPDWVHIEVNPQTLDDMVQKLMANNPNLAGMDDTIRQQVKAGVKFFGFEKQLIAKSFTTKVTLLKGPLPAGTTLAALVDQKVAQIQAQFKPTTTIDRKQRTTPHLEAERLRFNFQMAGPAGQLDLAIFQYYYVTGMDHFVLAFTTTVDRADHYTDIASSIGDSFRALQK